MQIFREIDNSRKKFRQMENYCNVKKQLMQPFQDFLKEQSIFRSYERLFVKSVTTKIDMEKSRENKVNFEKRHEKTRENKT